MEGFMMFYNDIHILFHVQSFLLLLSKYIIWVTFVKLYVSTAFTILTLLLVMIMMIMG